MPPGPVQSATPDSPATSPEIKSRATSNSNIDDLLARANDLTPDERLWLMASLWCELPNAHPAAPSPVKHSELQGYLDDYKAGRIETFPWQVVQGLMAGEAYIKSAKIYSVPRRFDLATIFVVTLAYSLLFGAMSAVSFPPVASAMVAGFILIVGVAQALLFGGKKPRTASIIAGAAIYSIAMLGVWIAQGPRLYSSWQMLVPATFMVASGGMLGYIAGVVIGGVFLVADKLRNRFSRGQIELND